jgi:hypothetical protein
MWSVFLFGVWNVGRVVILIQQSSLLIELTSKPDPRFRLVMALLWAILFGALVIGLWWKRPFTRRTIPITLLLYAVYELSLTTIFAQAPLAHNSWRINGIFYTIVILFSWWVMRQTAVQEYFEEEKIETSNQ